MKGMKVAVLAIGLASSVGTQASLLGRDLDGSAATYEAYYDDQLNITWLADANYAKTQYDQSGGVAGDADGYMRWSTAHAWAASLGYYGITGWRLPVMAPPAFFQGYRASNNGTEVGGYGATRTGWGLPTDADGIWSEMGWMYYFNLGNLGYCTPDDANPYGCVEQAGYNVKNRGPFVADRRNGAGDDRRNGASFGGVKRTSRRG